MNVHHTHLFWFILLSVGLHGLLLGAWQWDRQLELPVYASATPLLIAIDTERAHESQATKQSKSNHNNLNSVTRPVPVQKQVMAKSTTRPFKKAPAAVSKLKTANDKASILQQPKSLPVIKNTPEAPVIATRKAQPEDNARLAHQDMQRINKRIQQQLHTKILFNRHYPGIAIRNAWEGRVNLGMRVLANGKLTDIHVIDSSGYRILDNAAVKSIVRIAALPEASAWLQGREIDVILPVIYKLTDS